MKILVKHHIKIYRTLYNNYYNSEYYRGGLFQKFLKDQYDLTITDSGYETYWEDEYFIFNSQEDYFLFLMEHS